MNIKSLLILTITNFIVFQGAYADCLACWRLQNVRITMTNNEVIEGYIKWNESWLPESRSENNQLNSFYEKYLLAAENWNWEKLTIYKDVYELKQTLKISGLITSEESITEINIKEIIGIELYKNEKNNLEGAGDITDLEEESIELLKKPPKYMHKEEGTVSVTYFLSYNENINKESLIEISETSDYWLKRRNYEKDKVIIIIESWD